jgi:hypothetical protein
VLGSRGVDYFLWESGSMIFLELGSMYWPNACTPGNVPELMLVTKDFS